VSRRVAAMREELCPPSSPRRPRADSVPEGPYPATYCNYLPILVLRKCPIRHLSIHTADALIVGICHVPLSDVSWTTILSSHRDTVVKDFKRWLVGTGSLAESISRAASIEAHLSSRLF